MGFVIFLHVCFSCKRRGATRELVCRSHSINFHEPLPRTELPECTPHLDGARHNGMNIWSLCPRGARGRGKLD